MSKTIIAIVIIISVIGLGYWLYQSTTEKPSDDVTSITLEQGCREHNGTWLAEYQECEYVEKEWCEQADGRFFECESACRHNPDPAAPCTLQCVQVCKFGEEETSLGDDPLNSTYIIEGDEFALVDSKAEKEIVPGSASKIRINVFDANAKGDINEDGLDDTAVLLTYNAGGSGIFYYIAAAIQMEQGYKGTNAVFVGDRIAPQVTEIKEGAVIVNYANRYPWESFATSPSVWASKYLFFEEGELREIPRETLSQETAYNLVIENWGDCTPDICDELAVDILYGNDGLWFIGAVYDGMKDDSVRTQKRIAQVHYVNEEWKWGSELVKEYRCQPDRGHQDFSDELCI
jgi:hypothetical protein